LDADSLAKRLATFLSFDFRPEELRGRGLFDFLQFDRPDTDNPVVMGVIGFFYLFGEGDLSSRDHALRRIVAFICSQNGHTHPDAAAIRAAIQLLGTPVMDEEALWEWFGGNCC